MGVVDDVLRVANMGPSALARLLKRYELTLTLVADGKPIPGTFWGEPEAGIVGCNVYARQDTPVHSILHESGHLICASGERRESIVTDAGSDDLEEAAVCYLQILLADSLQGVGRRRLMRDMDDWGYSFRLGSTLAWFAEDAADALSWLQGHSIVAANGELSWMARR